jgi:hypothetical protein
MKSGLGVKAPKMASSAKPKGTPKAKAKGGQSPTGKRASKQF